MDIMDITNDNRSYTPEELDKVRAFFAGDLYATETTSIMIDAAGDGWSEVSLELGAKHKNAANAVMGAVYTTMADFAFAVAVNSGLALQESYPLTVTLSSTAYFLAAAKTGKLTARARCIRGGRQTCLYEVIISETVPSKEGDGNEIRELVRVEVQGFVTGRR